MAYSPHLHGHIIIDHYINLHISYEFSLFCSSLMFTLLSCKCGAADQKKKRAGYCTQFSKRCFSRQDLWSELNFRFDSLAGCSDERFDCEHHRPFSLSTFLDYTFIFEEASYPRCLISLGGLWGLTK